MNIKDLPTTPGSATERQAEYIAALLDERDLFKSSRFFDTVNAMDANEYAAHLERLKYQARVELSMATASAWIDALKYLPKKARTQRQSGPEPKAGMYRTPGGEILRVYLGQQSGKMLVKMLVPEGDGWTYDYVGAANGKASRYMRDAEPLPLEEAKKFGRMTGTCCVCARRLDVPESVEAGIGPVCAANMQEGF